MTLRIAGRLPGGIALLLALLHPLPLGGQAPDRLIRRVDAYVAPLVRMHDFAGTVLVAQHGRILLTRQYGLPSAASRARTDSTARYQIGSVAKTITAAAIELLARDGALSLTDPVAKFLPGFVHGDSITIEMLLGHTSGLQDYYLWPEYAEGWSRPLTDSAFLAIAQSKPLDFPPGTRSNYSNTGYGVLAAVVERASRLPFAQFLENRIFTPSGMTRAGELSNAGKAGLVPGRDAGFPPAWLQPALPIAPGWLKGNGSVYASAADLFRWAETVRNDKLIDAKQLKYPFGWGKRTRAGHPTIEDTGRVPTGYATYLGIVPDAELVVVVLSSIQAAVVEQMGIDLVSLALDQPYKVAALRAGVTRPPRLTRDELSAYAGRYQIAPGFVLTVRATAQGILLAGPDGLFLPLDPDSASRFFFRPLYLPVRFDRDSLSRVSALDWNGQFKAERLPPEPGYPGKEWPTGDPIRAGFTAAGLDSARDYLAGLKTTGLMVVQGGKVVWQYGDVQQTSYVASVRKSILSMLIGIHAARGEIALDSTIGFYGIDDLGGLSAGERGATVRDLLSARSGVYHAASNDGDDVDSTHHRDSKPHGTWFIYNNWDFNALGTIFERATHRSIYDALEQEIAQPIGMQDFHRAAQVKSGDSTRSIHPAYHMVLSTRDMARIGYLMLREGRWSERQVVPADWIAASTRAATPLADMNPPRMKGWWFGYGYLWWVWDGPRAVGPFAGAFTAMGAYGQFITVLPKIDMVIAHKTAVPPERTVEDNDYLRLVRRIVAAYHGPMR